MKRFIILYKGPATPPNAAHEGWPQWFDGLGDALVNKGGPMLDGWSVNASDVTSVQEPRLNGYSIIQAESASVAQSLLATHPYIALGSEYTIELYEIPAE